MSNQRKHVSSVAKSGDTKSLTASYRISNINIHMSHDEILQGLQNFPRERNQAHGKNPGQANTPPKLHRAPNGSGRQTAVIELDYRPRAFPQTHAADDIYVMTDEDRRYIFKSTGVLQPEVDAHFIGLTPLGGPWHDVYSGVEADEGNRSWYMDWLPFRRVDPQPSQIRFEYGHYFFLTTRSRNTTSS